METISLEEFERLPNERNRRRKSSITQAMREMAANTAIVVEHPGYCSKEDYGTPGKKGCYLTVIVSRLERECPRYNWQFKHIGDGKVAIACVNGQKAE